MSIKMAALSTDLLHILFYFSFASDERNATKLDWKKVLNVVCPISVYRVNPSTEVANCTLMHGIISFRPHHISVIEI